MTVWPCVCVCVCVGGWVGGSGCSWREQLLMLGSLHVVEITFPGHPGSGPRDPFPRLWDGSFNELLLQSPTTYEFYSDWGIRLWYKKLTNVFAMTITWPIGKETLQCEYYSKNSGLSNDYAKSIVCFFSLAWHTCEYIKKQTKETSSKSNHSVDSKK